MFAFSTGWERRADDPDAAQRTELHTYTLLEICIGIANGRFPGPSLAPPRASASFFLFFIPRINASTWAGNPFEGVAA